ncbi:hypothetical protein [Ferdinandcohnia sp. SAFN-114]|uniref:hypothetical protein n=1 Tax=Ferdinandcohnia sp. SAFN-114 TaxID=3387275 RepID=UPI003F7FC64C
MVKLGINCDAKFEVPDECVRIQPSFGQETTKLSTHSQNPAVRVRIQLLFGQRTAKSRAQSTNTALIQSESG